MGSPLSRGAVRPMQSPHDPILIQGNANFTPANGVLHGRGTESDPYVIAGWRIDASTANAIEIRDTTAIVRIQEVEVTHSSPSSPYAYGVFLGNATGVDIRFVNVSSGASGFYVMRSADLSVSQVTVDSNPGAGFIAVGSTNVTVRDSAFRAGSLQAGTGARIRFLSNQARGIGVGGASDIVIDGNRLDYGGIRGGIVLNWTDNARISRNVGVSEIATGWAGGGNNTQVIGNDVSGGEFGIKSYREGNLTVMGNNVSSQTFAALSVFGSSTVTVVGNRFAGSVRGAYLSGVTDLVFAHNDLDSNVKQAEITASHRVAWNETYPLGGNHWSDYAGVDQCSGPHQDVCTGPDGIGDVPYVIDTTDADLYPLMAAPRGAAQDSPPHAGFRVTPSSGNTSTDFTFDASPSWDPRDPLSALYVRWDWQGDGIWDTDWSVNKVVEHQFSDPAKYSVRLIVRNIAGLTANASAQVAVVLPPPTALSAAIEASPTSGTMPLTVSFISSGTGGVPPYGYHWDFGDGATSNAPNTVHIYVTGGDFPVSLLINDGTGVNAVSNVVVIHVTPAAVNLVVTTPHDFVATTSGFQVTFTASVTGGTPPYSYQWEFGDGTRSEEASPSHTYATAGAYSVSVTAIDAKGQSATHVFTLNVPPHSTGPPPGDPSGLFVSGISISAAAIFAILWWTERKKGRPPQARH